MQDMSDNELDNLFKEAAEGFTPPPDSSAWTQMSAMLDQAPVKPAGFWNWKTITGLTATGIIAVTAVWYGVRNGENSNLKTTEQYGSNNATQGVVQEQKEQTNPAGNENLASAKPLENESVNTSALTSTSALSRNKISSSNAVPIKRGAPAESNSVVERAVVNHNDVTIPVNEPRVIVSLGSEAQGQDNRDNSVSAPVGDNEVHATTVDQPSPQAKQTEEVIKTDSVQNPDAMVQSDSSLNKRSDGDEPEKSSKRLSVKAVVSPDFSSINFFSAGKTGFNYGILTGFSFNKRWSVATGIISSKKLYDSKDVAGDYELNGHKYPMKSIDGNCRIIDIPVNVYYTFFPDRSFSIRAGLGFSSYIMQSEKYRYQVDYYGHDAYYNKSVSGKNQEWFKMMNISVIVSKKLSDRFSAEFEPFVKAPLAGVGEGKVSLVSMGAFFSLKYDLLILK